MRLLYSSHGIHSPPASLQTATRLLDEATQYFEAAVEEAKVSAGSRKTVEGPHGVPSSKTVASIRMTLEALRGIERELKSVNPAYINHVNPKSLVTLVHDLHQVHRGAKVSDDAFVIVKCIQFLNVVGKKMNAQKTFRKYHICL